MDVRTRDGCRLHAERTGGEDRPAIICSNSLGTTLALWEGQVPVFAADRTVWRYDTRGHGRSDAPAGDYDIARLGEDLLALMDTAGVEHADLCGISIGGLTALWVAIHAPARVRRLVLANTGARIGGVELWHERMQTVRAHGVAALADATMQRWFTAGFRDRRPEVVARFRAMMEGTSQAGYLGCCAALRDADLRAQTSDVRCPTLVVTGAHDPATPPADGEWLARTIPGARLVELPSAHISNVECADAFNRAVTSFLAA